MKKLFTKKTLVPLSFILPNFIGFAVFTLIPIIFSFILSVSKWNIGPGTLEFVGLDNFRQMIKDDTFFISLKNTIYYTVGVVPATVILSLLLAMVMNMKLKGRTFFRSVIFFPYVASLVAIAVVWNALFHPETGPVNQILMSIGITEPPRWAASITWAMPTLILLSIWKNVGYYTIVYLAALQGVPKSLYEAARIDGANAFQRFIKITWPMVTPTTFFVTIMLTMYTFKVFDLMMLTTQGGPGRATNVLVYHIYNQAFISMNFGYASALSVVLFVIVLVVTLTQFRTEKKFTEYL